MVSLIFSNSFKTIDISELKFKIPSSQIYAGPSGSGKTFLTLKVLDNLETMFDPVPEQVVYAYSELNSAVPIIQKKGLESHIPHTLHYGVPSNEFLDRCKKPLLLILDDLMLKMDKKYLDHLFTVKSHHRNIGVIFLVQNLFEKVIKTARDNCQYMILMNAPSSKRQIRDIGSSLFPGKTREFMEIYEEVTSKKYGYLALYLHANTDKDCILRTNIFPDEFTRVYCLLI